jgi:hypothetical protein
MLCKRRYVHAVAEEIAPAHDHIADVHADAEPQTPILLKAVVCGAQLFLNFDSTLNCINDTWELGKHAVTGGVRDPASVFGDEPVHDLAVSRQGAQGPDFIVVDQARVASHIGHKDRRQLALYPLRISCHAETRSMDGVHERNVG